MAGSARRHASGRQAVLDAWERLSPTVHRGRFTSPDTTVPSALAWKTVVLKVIPPGYSKNDLLFDRAIVDEAEADRIRDSILSAAHHLDSASQLMSRAYALTQRARLGDVRHRLANDAFETAASLDEHPIPDEHLDALAADIANDAAVRLLRQVDELFASEKDRARLTDLLDLAWEEKAPHRVRRDDGGGRKFPSRLLEYVRSATFAARNGEWVPHFADADSAERAWMESVEADRGLDFVSHPEKYGLDSSPVQRKPAVSVQGRVKGVPPLARSVQDRARSVAKGADSGDFTDEVGTASDVALRAVEAASSPLGLATAQGRTALAMGVLLFMDADPDRASDSHTYASHKLQRFRDMIVRSHRADRGRVDQLYDAMVIAIPQLWVALHNLEHRGESIRSHERVWRVVGGAAETLVRDLKQKFIVEDATDDGVVVIGTTSAGPADPADPVSDAPERRSEQDSDAAVMFTIRLLQEHERHVLDVVEDDIQATSADPSGRAAARNAWDAGIEAVVSRRLPLGRQDPGDTARFVTRDDLASFAEFRAFVDRHRRS